MSTLQTITALKAAGFTSREIIDAVKAGTFADMAGLVAA
jgi:alkylhydroperoxidase family enzyme